MKKKSPFRWRASYTNKFCILIDNKPYWFDLKHILQGLKEDIEGVFDALEDSKDWLKRFTDDGGEAFRYTGTHRVNLNNIILHIFTEREKGNEDDLNTHKYTNLNDFIAPKLIE